MRQPQSKPETTASSDRSTTRKASDIFVRCLEAEGVTHIFGVPGELIPALEEAFRQEGPALIAVPVDYAENLKLTKRLGEIECTI